MREEKYQSKRSMGRERDFWIREADGEGASISPVARKSRIWSKNVGFDSGDFDRVRAVQSHAKVDNAWASARE